MRRSLYLACLLVIAAPMWAGSLPKPQGRISDFAAILDPQTKADLEQKSKALDQATTDELAVVTVPSLNGEGLEEYANRLFHEWGIGKKDKNNGVLVFIAPVERKIRIEVGYGLEAVLPDGLAGSVIRENFAPAFKRGDMNGGVRDGVGRLIRILQANQPAPIRPQRQRSFHGETFPFRVVCLMTVFFGLFVGIGLFMLGAAVRAKAIGLVIWGSMFGGIPFLMSFAFGVSPFILAPLALAALVFGFIKGGSSTFRKTLRGSSRSSKSSGWVMGGSSSGSGSDSGSSGGGDFGGGDSGGGGASGSW